MVNRNTLVRAGTYALAGACVAAGLYLTKEEVIPLISNPQFVHDFTCRCVPVDEFIGKYGTAHPGADVAAYYLLGVLTAGCRIIADHYDGFPIEKMLKDFPLAASNKIIKPLQKRVHDRNANSIVAMNISLI
jgi:hypothetical protein